MIYQLYPMEVGMRKVDIVTNLEFKKQRKKKSPDIEMLNLTRPKEGK